MTNKEYRRLYMQRYRTTNLEYTERGKELAKKHYHNNTEQHKSTVKQYADQLESGVYMIKNKITGQCYIGQSVKPNRRRTEHFSKLTTNHVSNSQLQNAIKQYGKICFVFGVLEHCSKEELLVKEKYYIDLYKPEYNAN
jgi:predicted GIY-YIG superfamily endonuclease